ncbi:MAG: GntT/GntP/DsdX family permease [Mucilaginibacter sp.]
MILILIAGIAILLLMIGLLKINAFIALIVSALFVGVANGMSPVTAITKTQ